MPAGNSSRSPSFFEGEYRRPAGTGVKKSSFGMADTKADESLPNHIETSVEAIARLHSEHFDQLSKQQKLVERLTHRAARPAFLAWLTAAIAAWIVLNCFLSFTGRRPFDKFPFAELQGLISTTALYMTLLVLVTQRREDQLANRRDQLTLELALLSDQKSAKIIQLLDALGQDHPRLRDQFDAAATAMTEPADPQALSHAISDRHDAHASDAGEKPSQA